MRRLIRKPFFGCVAWEWQVGPLVMQRFYEGTWDGKRWSFWRDPFWR